jgi:Putative holin
MVIPLPRPWLLTSAMLLGVAAGLLGATAALTVDHARMRPDVAIALVVGFPSAVGLLVIVMARRRWLTALGAFVLALAPGYFGALALVEVVTRG